MTDTTEPVFDIALTMAGAVSAGAYTAGVVDFLVLALAEHEKARGAGPKHRVVLKAMSGASAGGVVAALAVPPLARGPLPEPRQIQAKGATGFTMRATLPDLYRLWVEELSFLAPDGGDGLLGKGDVEAGKSAPSLLDSTYLEKVADGLLADVPWSGVGLPYVARDLDLFLTTTNLRGVPYTVRFDGSSTTHTMAWHADWRHVRVVGLGSVPRERAWLAQAGDDGIRLDLTGLAPGQVLPFAYDPKWRALRDAGIATGAFPAGFAARAITGRTTGDYGRLEGEPSAYHGRAWPICLAPGQHPPVPDWPKNKDGTIDYDVSYVAVDGGACNNEPFELARYALMAGDGEGNLLPNERGPLHADRAVVMIDPFPEPPAFNPDASIGPMDFALRRTLAGTLGALKNQARFKMGEVVNALDARVFSRFLISPRRAPVPDDPNPPRGVPDGLALATGGLGAFMGFFDQRFREHDYQLGRRNCQRFLRLTFRLAEDHRSLFSAWNADDRRRFRSAAPDLKDFAGRPRYSLPVIPLTGFAAEEERLYPWPRIGRAEIDAVMGAIQRRAAVLLPAVLQDLTSSAVLRQGLRLVWSTTGKGKALDTIRRTIEAELILRDQHQDWIKIENRIERAVIAALVSKRDDLRTVKGLAREIPNASETAIKIAVERHKNRLWFGPKHKGGADTFTLKTYQPNLLYRLRGVGVDLDRLG